MGYSDPSVLGVGGDVTPIWRSDPPRWLPEELYWVIGCTYTGMPVEPAPIRNPIGANMSIRADVFAGAGGFRQELGRLDVAGRPSPARPMRPSSVSEHRSATLTANGSTGPRRAFATW